MAENVPEFAYLRHDREQLLRTLTRFDDGLRVDDVVGPENEDYNLRQHSNTLLLQVLLEFICYAFVKDGNEREILLIEACKRLSKSKILNDTLIMDKNNPLRKAMKQNVISFFEQVCKDVIPTAELNTTAVSLLQNDSISTDLQLFYCENFDELCQIGKGGFGSVYKAQYKLNKLIYAIKKIPFVYKTDTCFLTVMREANNFATLSHPNIVRYHSAWIEIEKSTAVNKSTSYTGLVPDIHAVTKHSGIVIKQTPPSSSVSLRTNNFGNVFIKGSENESDSIVFLESAELSKDVNLRAESCSQNSSNHSCDSNDCHENYSNVDHESIENDTNKDSKGFLESESDSIIFSESAKTNKDVNWTIGNFGQSFSSRSDEDDESAEDCNPNNKNSDPDDNGDNSLSNLKVQGMLYIQMEYCDCDLRFWLLKRAETKGKELPFEMDVHEIFLDIVKGVHHIHSRNIIHRDLKPHNIFYSKASETIKIGDFGLATLTGYADSPNYRSRKHSSNVGTIPYAAPEQRKSKTYDTKVDIYSLGIILIELINVCSTRTELCHIIKDMKDGQIVEGMKKFPVLGKLAKNLISDNPKMRMSAKEIITLIDKDAKVILKEVVMSELAVDIKKKDDKIKDLNEIVKYMQESHKKMQESHQKMQESHQKMEVTVTQLQSEVITLRKTVSELTMQSE